MRCKYIVWSASEYVLFPESMKHSDVARRLFHSRKPESAGFVSFGINADREVSVVCYGESESLGLKSKPSDSKIIQFMVMY